MQELEIIWRGTRTLDELLENKVVIDQVAAEDIERRVADFGHKVDSLVYCPPLVRLE